MPKNNIKNECVYIHPWLVEIDKPGDRWVIAGDKAIIIII
jgi:hypothetical protein